MRRRRATEAAKTQLRQILLTELLEQDGAEVRLAGAHDVQERGHNLRQELNALHTLKMTRSISKKADVSATKVHKPMAVGYANARLVCI